MSNLQNQYIDESFQKLVQVSDDGTILDGTGSVITSLDLDVTTATTALSASHASNANSASYALTASYAENIDLPAGVVSGSSQVILQDTTGDLLGGRISGPVSDAVNAVSSSYAVNATSSSFSNTSISSSHSLTADTSISSSHSLVADQAINATNSQYADNTVVYGKNLSGAEIPKGTPLYFTDSGTQGNLVGVYPADAANPNRMPAAGVAGETLGVGAEGVILLDGFINGVDTSLFASGDSVYVAAGGGYTNQRPTGSTILVQGLGYIEKSAVNGSGVIQGSGRANDVPNIQEGFGWFGNNDGVAEAQSTASFAKTDKNNVFTGTQTYDNITVNGTGSFAYIQSVTGSAKIIGDAFIILNNDLPAERYAGIVVQDSGSGSPLTTASLQFDGQENDWFYQYSDDGGVTTDHGVVLFGPEYSAKGTPTYPTNNRVQKGNGGHHLLDSNILDDGSNITLDSAASVTGDNTLPANSFDVKNGLGQSKLSVANASLKTITGIDVGILGKLQTDDLNVTNNTTVTGSLTTNSTTSFGGNGTRTGYEQQTFNAPGPQSQLNFLNIGDMTFDNGQNYTNSSFNMQHYGGDGSSYKKALVYEFWDSFGYNYGTEAMVGPKRAGFTMVPSGSGFSKQSFIELIQPDLTSGTSQLKMAGPTIQIGSNGFPTTETLNMSSQAYYIAANGDAYGALNFNYINPTSGSNGSFFNLGQEFGNPNNSIIDANADKIYFQLGNQNPNEIRLGGGSTTNVQAQTETFFVNSSGDQYGAINLNYFNPSGSNANITAGQNFGDVTKSQIDIFGTNVTLSATEFITAQTETIFLQGAEFRNGVNVQTGRSRGSKLNITVVPAGTSTMDCSTANFFDLPLNGVSTTLTATNIIAGQTISVRVVNTGTNTLSFDTMFEFAGGTPPTITENGTDILTFISFDGTTLYSTAVQNLS